MTWSEAPPASPPAPPLDEGLGRPSLLEQVPHVGLGLSEPHGQQLGTLDGDGLSLVNERLT